MRTEYVVFTTRIVGSGFEAVHYSDNRRFPTNADAMSHGWTLGEGDDFNIGKLEEGKLTDILWMLESRGDAPKDIEDVGRDLGWWPEETVAQTEGKPKL